ncbi:MAG: hypothetical protein HYR94_06225 [Chloroflexi bacterium]|nr:hypothetical protein [Chloroflexota bacterium]
MSKDLVNGIIFTVVVAVIGIVFLYFAAQGAMPTGFGLFNMDSWGTRSVLFILLVIIVVILGVVYMRGQNKKET